MSNTDGGRDYEVGYGKPPKQHQFKPGQSGNPKGRPKGTKNLKTDLFEELAEKLTVTEGGRTLKLSKQRVMLKALMAKAAKGDVRAANKVINLVRSYAVPETSSGEEELGLEDEAILEAFMNPGEPAQQSSSDPRSKKGAGRTQRKRRGAKETGVMSARADRRRALRAVLRKQLAAFIQKAFGTVTPHDVYTHNWHIEAIAYALERVLLGETRRLLITQPPRSLKSISSSVAFVAFALGRDPSLRVFCISYSESLAKVLTRQFRYVVESDWYRELFPRVRFRKATELEVFTTMGGGRIATSIGGTLTGRGADIILIDDPMKAEDAQSEAERRRVKAWYKEKLLSRLNDKRTGKIILVMQRLHEDDLAGVVLEEQGRWAHLDLPAIAAERQTIALGNDRTYTREVGEPLHAEREPVEELECLKSSMGSLAFSAQYQQRPVPLEGNLIKHDWLQVYETPPAKKVGVQIIQSWDVASTTGEANDWSVCTTWAKEKKRYYLLHVWRGKLEFPKLKRKVIALAEEYAPNVLLIEKAGPGLHLIQELRTDPPKGVPAPIGIKPEGDKIVRMEAQSARFEAEQVFLPKDASWLDTFLHELLAFPHARHDDQVDSVSQFLNWAERDRGHGGMALPGEYFGPKVFVYEDGDLSRY